MHPKLQKQFQLMLLLVWVAALQACAFQAPVSVAQTPEQKAYAAYGTFVIFEEKAAELVTGNTLSDDVKLRIIEADEAAKPVADNLLETIEELGRIGDQVAAGETGEEQYLIVVNSLNSWVEQLVPLVNNLIAAVKGAN